MLYTALLEIQQTFQQWRNFKNQFKMWRDYRHNGVVRFSRHSVYTKYLQHIIRKQHKQTEKERMSWNEQHSSHVKYVDDKKIITVTKLF